MIAKDLLTWRLGLLMHMSNLFLTLLIPILVINVKSDQIGVGAGTNVALAYTFLFFKMWSYVQVLEHKHNYWSEAYRNFQNSSCKNVYVGTRLEDLCLLKFPL